MQNNFSSLSVDSVVEIFKHLDITAANDLCRLDKNFLSFCERKGFKEKLLPFVIKNSVKQEFKDAYNKMFSESPEIDVYTFLYNQQTYLTKIFNCISRLPYSRKRLYRALVSFAIIEEVLRQHQIADKAERFIVYSELANVIPEKVFRVIGEIIMIFVNGYIWIAQDQLKRGGGINSTMNHTYMFLSLTPNELCSFLESPEVYLKTHHDEFLEPYLPNPEFYERYEYQYQIKADRAMGVSTSLWLTHLGMFGINESAIQIFDGGLLFQDDIAHTIDFIKDSRIDKSLDTSMSQEEIDEMAYVVKKKRSQEQEALYEEPRDNDSVSDSDHESDSDIEYDSVEDQNEEDEEEMDFEEEQEFEEDGMDIEEEQEMSREERMRLFNRRQYEQFMSKVRERVNFDTKKGDILAIVDKLKQILKAKQ